jgi:predicted small lipoprotein YifL
MQRLLLSMLCLALPLALAGCGGPNAVPPKGTVTDPGGTNTDKPGEMKVPPGPSK